MAQMKLMLITDVKIVQMLKSSEYRAAFPFIDAAAANLVEKEVPRTGNCCKKKKKYEYSGVNYNEIKAAMISMDETKRALLKSMLGTDTARVQYKSNTGKVIGANF